MQNFPSKWFEFTNHKELIRLRKDLNNSFALKIEIAASIIVAIVSVFLQKTIDNAETYVKILFCVVLCLFVVLIFLFPFFLKFIKNKKRNNILIKGKDAINLFDDEITYNVLVATEYYSLLESVSVKDSKLKDELINFYNLEIKYYIKESVDILNLFFANFDLIVGEKNNQISKERIINVLNMINTLIENCNITLDYDMQKDLDGLIEELTKSKD